MSKVVAKQACEFDPYKPRTGAPAAPSAPAEKGAVGVISCQRTECRQNYTAIHVDNGLQIV